MRPKAICHECWVYIHVLAISFLELLADSTITVITIPTTLDRYERSKINRIGSLESQLEDVRGRRIVSNAPRGHEVADKLTAPERHECTYDIRSECT